MMKFRTGPQGAEESDLMYIPAKFIGKLRCEQESDRTTRHGILLRAC